MKFKCKWNISSGDSLRESSGILKFLFLYSFFTLIFLNLINSQVSDYRYSIRSDFPIHVKSGWNLLSLPAIVTDGSFELLFQNAVSKAFIFYNEYISEDTLTNGPGFWIKFDSAETLFVTGNMISELRIPVSTGWNLIGSLTTPFLSSTVTSEPPGIIVSDFFEYFSGNYQTAEAIRPGSGYWIKVDQNGFIDLSAMGEPCPGIPTVEYEGKIYNTVLIEEHCWLRENLDVGTRIGGAIAQTDNDEIEKYCYADIPAMCEFYGGLYQWGEAVKYDTTVGRRGICPVGWHIPTTAEFQELQSAVGSHGNSLKTVGVGTGNGEGTNSSGFSALLTGYRNYTGSYQDIGNNVYFWTSTAVSTSYSNSLYLNGWTDVIAVHNSTIENGFAVRCIRD